MPAIRILGIDPGLNRTGFGLIDVEGSHLRFVDCGVIVVPSGELAHRLGHILARLREVITLHRPAHAVVEKVFVNVNPQSTLLLGQARGAALCAAVDSGLSVHEYTALQVKQAVVGYGKADKRQVQDMVQRLLALGKAPSTDAADALGCAICHAHTAPRTKAAASIRASRGGRANALDGAKSDSAGNASALVPPIEPAQASVSAKTGLPADQADALAQVRSRGSRSRRSRSAWRAVVPD